MTVFEATPASSRRHTLAEGPVWVAEKSLLLWVDVEEGIVFVGRIADGLVEETRRFAFAGTVGAVVPADDGSLLVAARDRLIVIDADLDADADADLDADDGRRDGPVILQGSDLRANDGGCDPAGRFIIGTCHFDERPGQDTLQRLELDGTLTMVDDDLSISNGLAWSPDGSLFYSTDTANRTVWVRDYDAVSGGFGPRRRHLTIDGGYPDGLTMDSRGQLWIAIWGGFEVRSFAPDGTPGDTVRLPVPDVSSVCFVGDDLDLLVITTSSRDLDAAGRARYPNAGRLFLADVGVTGQPTTPWNSAALKEK